METYFETPEELEEMFDYDDDFEDYIDLLEEDIFNFKKSNFGRNKKMIEKNNRRYVSSFKERQKERREERIEFHFQSKELKVEEESISNESNLFSMIYSMNQEEKDLKLAIENSLNYVHLNEWEFERDVKNGNLNECGISIQTLKDLLTRDLTPNDYETLLLLDENNKKKTISNKKLDTFEERKVNLIDEREIKICSICMEEFKIDEIIRILPCKHEFHKDCIDYWLLEKSIKCPLDSIEF